MLVRGGELNIILYVVWQRRRAFGCGAKRKGVDVKARMVLASTYVGVGALPGEVARPVAPVAHLHEALTIYRTVKSCFDPTVSPPPPRSLKRSILLSSAN